MRPNEAVADSRINLTHEFINGDALRPAIFEFGLCVANVFHNPLASLLGKSPADDVQQLRLLVSGEMLDGVKNLIESCFGGHRGSSQTRHIIPFITTPATRCPLIEFTVQSHNKRRTALPFPYTIRIIPALRKRR